MKNSNVKYKILMINFLKGIILSIVFFLIFEGIIKVSSLNVKYRQTKPSTLIRTDSVFLYRLRENLNFFAPRFTLQNINKIHSLKKKESGERKFHQNGFFHISTDNRGFRSNKDINIDKKIKLTKYDVICLGDSVTFGWGNRNETTYPSILEKYLSARYNKSVSVLNAGQPGFSSYQGMLFYNKVIAKMLPKILIVAFGHNDHNVAISGFHSAKEKFIRNTNGLNKLKIYFERSDFFLLSERLLTHITGKVTFWVNGFQAKKLANPGSISEYRENLTKIVQKVKSHNGKCYFLTEPANNEDAIIRSYNNAIRELGTALSVPVIDIIPCFVKEEKKLLHNNGNFVSLPNKLFWDNIHPTALGNQLIAKMVSKKISQNNVFNTK